MGNGQGKEGSLDDNDEFLDAVSGDDYTPEKASTSLAASGKGAQPPATGVRLYKFRFGSSSGAPDKWLLAERDTRWRFEDEETDGEDEDDRDDAGYLPKKVLSFTRRSGYIKTPVTEGLGMLLNDDQLRADFKIVSKDSLVDGIWALKFATSDEYKDFVTQFQDCIFENTFGMPATSENRVKVMGKEFLPWASGVDADETMWEAEDTYEDARGDELLDPNIKETYQEKTPVKGITGFTMGARENSYLLHEGGVNVFKNMQNGIQSKGVSISLDSPGGYTTPKKGLLIRGETNMMLMSPQQGAFQASGVRQLDIESGKIVANWEFQKDGVPIQMRDVVNDTKSSQLDPSRFTFMGLDDNRLCRWDMRDRNGIVQDVASPVLNWADGHQFSRGTNFRCMATAGDGSVAVGSLDGKIRLYSTSTLRQAKTVFPGLGFPITAIDVTYDGKWILATTDHCLVVICTVFRDSKDGRERTGFQAKGAKQMNPPRLLKLSTQHAYQAGEHKFTQGQFSWVTEDGQPERNLVATVGNYSVIWNFRRVKQSSVHSCYTELAKEGLKSCYCYKIVPKDETIVDSRFMHDNFVGASTPEAPLIIATPSALTSFNVSSLD